MGAKDIIDVDLTQWLGLPAHPTNGNIVVSAAPANTNKDNLKLGTHNQLQTLFRAVYGVQARNNKNTYDLLSFFFVFSLVTLF